MTAHSAVRRLANVVLPTLAQQSWQQCPTLAQQHQVIGLMYYIFFLRSYNLNVYRLWQKLRSFLKSLHIHDMGPYAQILDLSDVCSKGKANENPR